MTLAEHLIRIDGRDYSPRVIERRLNDGSTGFYMWTAGEEGPLRHDYPSAQADLLDYNHDRERRRKLMAKLNQESLDNALAAAGEE